VHPGQTGAPDPFEIERNEEYAGALPERAFYDGQDRFSWKRSHGVLEPLQGRAANSGARISTRVGRICPIFGRRRQRLLKREPSLSLRAQKTTPSGSNKRGR
jgi:hypothetical protein